MHDTSTSAKRIWVNKKETRNTSFRRGCRHNVEAILLLCEMEFSDPVFYLVNKPMLVLLLP